MRNTRLSRPGATALVTGASSGIGAATTRLLAHQGFRLVVNSRGGPELDDIAAETGARPFPLDLTRPGAAETVHEEVTAAIGTPDLLVCNAGAGWQGPLQQMPAETVTQLLRLNVAATVDLVRVFAGDMVDRGSGHLVLVSSIAGNMGVPREAAYSASKAALLGFGQSMRLELARTGVDITMVHPGVVDTAFFHRRGSPYQHRRPRPIPPQRVARALLDGARRGRSEVFVPAWLRFPARLQGAAPGFVGAIRRGL